MSNLHTKTMGIITCNHCNRIPVIQALYQCNERHTICESCYLDANLGECRNKCPICGDRNIFRNLLAEELLKQHLQDNVTTENQHTSRSSSKRQKSKHTGHHPSIIRNSPSFFNISKKPFNCPNTKCNQMVAVTQLLSHFTFDHSKTPQEFLRFDQDKTMDLSFNNMTIGDSHIIALLMVPVEVEGPTSTNNGFVFPLMAAKLSLSCKTNESLNGNNLVVIWMSGNMEDMFLCRIEVSDDKKRNMHAYRGGINSLRASNKPTDVFQRANCLIIHSNSIRRITQDGTYPMELKVRISCANGKEFLLANV